MKKNGFTLIEIMIAVTIFTVAVLMSAGALAVSQRMRQKAENFRAVNDEARYIAEFIQKEVKDIKYGSVPGANYITSYSSKSVLILDPQDGTRKVIALSASGKSLVLTKIDSSGNVSEYHNINSSKVDIKSVNFNCSLYTPIEDTCDVTLVVEEAGANRMQGEKSKMFNKLLGEPVQMQLNFTVKAMAK